MSDFAISNLKNTDEKQYIMFQINKEFYGIDISCVNNIIQMCKITRVPMAPDYFKGIINLRGQIIPVVSIRKRMNLEDDVITNDSRIIILNLDNDELMGIVVDSVKEVVTLSNDEIEEPSPLLQTEESFISGVGRRKDELISIFEVESILEDDEAC